MKSRPPSIGLAALAGIFLLASGSAQAGERREIERTEEFFVVKVKAPLPEVLTALEAAIARRNYFVAGTNHLDDTLRRRAAELGTRFDFDHYKVLSFCNLTLADEALRAHPYVGAFMPCRVAVFAQKGSPDVIIVTMRPTFLSRLFRSPEVERLARRVEADVLAILEMVAKD
jgi:uncharacterized protein (DUF302 family)